ncbi:protein phosphatase 2C domain-containing protein [Sphingomonas sp. AOB5]|uniref:protein phosphatase 2C domain-containing protein n=1 Tax=Sphingomonas sp. AOB5 TaxID=3034017 RepID=UPI0023F84A0B|nr:protein phosphatase 2C domain-containing protein [Sphingomonas sp. AOB5]MDF7777588.1 protein phosphatase 2C domain-containing protein [Sphingomonas sp. AOB5]
MHFDLIQSLSLAGDAAVPNDDRAGAGEMRAWVIDGATDLGPPGLVGPRGGAAWLSSEAHLAFATTPDAPVEAMSRAVGMHLAAAFEAARTREPEGRWELPLASFLAARIAGSKLEAAWLGDCVALLGSGETTVRLGPVRETRDAEAELAASLASHGLGAPKKSEPILASLKERRGRPGIRVLSVDPVTMAEIDTAATPCAPGDDLLLMTDGFAALVDSYGAYDEAGLMAAVRASGLAALAAELRAIETGDDFARFPRFKRSDDATALWLRIAG